MPTSPMIDTTMLDLDQLLSVMPSDMDLFSTPFDSLVAGQEVQSPWSSPEQLIEEIMAASPATAVAAASPALSDVQDALFDMAFPAATDMASDKFFRDLASPQTTMGSISPALDDLNMFQDSPASLASYASPNFDVPIQTDQTWAGLDDSLLFPALFSPKQVPTPTVNMPTAQPMRTPVPPRSSLKALAPAPAAPAPAPIAPLPSTLLPLLSSIGPTAASLALNPTALAAASAATGVDVKQLQQQLQAFATMQARQTPTYLKPSVEFTPPANTGRKRKERPVSAEAVFAELDMKRQKNTEAARRSRQKKMERMSELEQQVKELENARDALKSQVVELEVQKDQSTSREMMYLSTIAAMQQKLQMFEET